MTRAARPRTCDGSPYSPCDAPREVTLRRSAVGVILEARVCERHAVQLERQGWKRAPLTVHPVPATTTGGPTP